MTKTLTFEQLLDILPPGGYRTVEREIMEDCKEYVYPKLDNNHTKVQRTHYLELEHPDEELPSLFLAVRVDHFKVHDDYHMGVLEYVQFDNEEEQLEHMHRETLVNPTEQTKFLSN